MEKLFAFLGSLFLLAADAGAKAKLIGSVRGTYYYAAREADHRGPAQVALLDRDCKAIVRVARSFAKDLRMQGSGILKDHRVVNVRRCRCRSRPCFNVIDSKRFPHGMGARGNALVPLRSLAVDRRVIPLGVWVYLKGWDGRRIPRIDGLGGFVHDGCFRTDDVGVRGMRYDLFTGTRAMWRALERVVPTKKRMRAYRAAPRCRGKQRSYFLSSRKHSVLSG